MEIRLTDDDDEEDATWDDIPKPSSP
jgi:hypothetical protein